MRVVAGKWEGRNIVSPGKDVRPTAEGLRVLWLDALSPVLDGARILDLFAGSGALAIEALSRGGKSADFVENGAASLHSLKANVAAFHLGKRARVFKRDAIPFMEALSAGAYDVAFADPPYGSKKLDRVVTQWLRVPFSRVLSVDKEQEYTPASTYNNPRTRYYSGGGGGLYGYGFYGFYGTTYAQVHEPGYFETSTTLKLETNLYSVATDGLVWTGQSETVDPASLADARESMTTAVTKKLKEERLIP